MVLAGVLYCAPAIAQAIQPETRSTKSAVADQQSAVQDKERPVKLTWDNRPSLRFGQFARIDFRVRFQADARQSSVPLEPGESMFSWARKRVGVDGEFGRVFSFQIERELADANDPWRDVFIDYGPFDQIHVRAGKFKLPFSLDQNTSASNLDFVYRSRAADQLAPGRDRGVMVHGRVVRRILEYEVGVFDHDGRNTRRPASDRVSGGRAVAARLTAQPLRTTRSSGRTLEFGAAIVTSRVGEGFPSIRGQTAFGDEFYDPDLWVLGPQRRVGFELRWRPGPFSVKSEYMRLTTDRQHQSVEDLDLSPFLAVGWYVSGTWILTGERKANGLEDPRRPFLGGGIGAIELALRVESLELSSVARNDVPSLSPRADVVFGNRLRAVTTGVTWQPVRWIKLQFNLIRESIEHPEMGPLPGQSAFSSRVLRIQFAL